MNESQPSQPPQYNTPTPPTNYQQNSNSYPGNNSYITSNVTSYEQLQPPPYNATILPNSNMTYNLPPTTPLISTNICWGETYIILYSITENSFFFFRPVRYTCQFCSSQIVTNVVYENGTLTWLTAGMKI